MTKASIIFGILTLLSISSLANESKHKATKACDKTVQAFLVEELEYLNVDKDSDDGIDSMVELESQYNCEFKGAN